MITKFSEWLKERISKLNKAKFIKIAFIAFFCFLIIGFILLFIQIKGSCSLFERDAVESVKIAPENLFLSDDPLALPPIQFSREQRKTWTDKKIKGFFIMPGDGVMKDLHDKNNKKIEKLLEGTK